MPTANYEERKERSRRREAEQSRSGRDVAPGYPPPGDLARRAACERDLKRFCDTYFPAAFALPWSPDHLRVLARLQEVILEGGLFAVAMPRGSGKTTITVRAALWGLLYGHRRFLCLVAASEELARRLLKTLKTELTFNEELVRDFRQVCYPLVCLQNNARRCVGQLFEGEQTRVDWADDRLTFPTVPDHACDGPNVSGSTVTVGGITGALRGQSHTLATGEVIRPEVVILDDPQTRESATSPSQSETRAAIILGDVLGMAGPGRDIAAVMPCTVIRAGDMAAVMLDRQQNPEWSGQLTKMVYRFPDNERLWEEYGRILAEGLRAERGPAEATEFYRRHRVEMDAGAVVAWPERYGPKEISALQSAMNLRLRNREAFYAEYQNEPIVADVAAADDLTPDRVARKLNRRKRGEAPVGVDRLTAFIDVQATLLYYCVCGWEGDFTGYVVDYGTFPDQRRAYYTLADARVPLASAVPAPGLEGQIYGGLEALTGSLLTRRWPRDDGAVLSVERCLIDANWGNSTDVIYQFCRQSAFPAVVMPSHGRYIGAASCPMREYRNRPGDRVGLNWRVPNVQGRRSVRYCLFDANFWKSFVLARLAVPQGDRGCLSLWGDDPAAHRLFADHLCAEYRVRTEGRGRVVDEFKIRPHRPDNHYFDCLTGCAVAASVQGVTLPGPAAAAPDGPRRRVSFAELQRRKRA